MGWNNFFRSYWVSGTNLCRVFQALVFSLTIFAATFFALHTPIQAKFFLPKNSLQDKKPYQTVLAHNLYNIQPFYRTPQKRFLLKKPNMGLVPTWTNRTLLLFWPQLFVKSELVLTSGYDAKTDKIRDPPYFQSYVSYMFAD